MVDIHTPDGAVKLLSDWFVENMYEEIKAITPTSGNIDIIPSKLLDEIVSLYHGDELQKIIQTAFLDAKESVKRDKVTNAHEKLIESVNVDTSKDKIENVVESKKTPKKKIGKFYKISGIIIAICVVLVIAGLVNADSRYWGLTDAQRSTIKTMEDACDSNTVMAYLQSDETGKSYHDGCYRHVDSQIEQFRSLNQK